MRKGFYIADLKIDTAEVTSQDFRESEKEHCFRFARYPTQLITEPTQALD